MFREFNPDWLAPLASNLRYLILRNNEIRRFPPAAFSRFTQLFQLEFSGNENTFIPSDAFDGLRLLYDLEMANCGLMDLNPHWFKGMRFLNRLEVDMNGITELPEGIFDLPYLRILGMAFNRLRVLDSRAFGAAVDTIANLDAEQNEIDAIDRRIVNNGTMLTNLLLVGNTCIDANFQDVQNNLGVVVENLQGCFSNFDNL